MPKRSSKPPPEPPPPAEAHPAQQEFRPTPEWIRKAWAATRCVQLLVRIQVRSEGAAFALDDTNAAAHIEWLGLMERSPADILEIERELEAKLAGFGLGWQDLGERCLSGAAVRPEVFCPPVRRAIEARRAERLRLKTETEGLQV